MLTPRQTNQEIAKELGRRIRRYRLSALNPPAAQTALARRTGLSEPTIKRLEAGGNATLLTFISVLRELGLIGNLDQLIPEAVEPSPMDLLKHARPERLRAPPTGKAKARRDG